MSEAPEPLLLERRVETGDDLFVERVTADGRVWVLTTVDAHLEGGEWSFASGQPASWEYDATLSAAALAALRDAVAASGFFETAAEHRPDVAVIHASREVWTAELDGRRHTSTIHARGVTEVPELAALARALERALATTDEASS